MPQDLAAQAITHASWADQRELSYERLAFLGDSVLSLAVTSHIYPRLGEGRFGPGRLTKIRAQAVSGRSCRQVAERIGLPDRLLAQAPADQRAAAASQLGTERVLASAMEAVIGACYLHHGFEDTAAAVISDFSPQIDEALESPDDHKSALQERLAQHRKTVTYRVISEEGPPHDRVFTVAASVAEDEIGRGSGRSKKDAEQAAAESALDEMA